MADKRDATEMNVQETTNPQEEAAKIWAELDEQDKGGAQPSGLSSNEPPKAGQIPSEPAPAAPAAQADANGRGDESESMGQQSLMDKVSGLEAQLGQALQRLRHAEGHIGGLNSQLKQQLQAAQQVSSKGGDAPTAGEIRQAQQNPKAMDALKRDYPEFGQAMEEALNERMQLLGSQMPQQQAVVTPAEISLLRREMAVEVRHPGWQDRVQTPEFVGWLHRQPREVQMLAASDSPQDAVRLLDLHSEASKSVALQRTQRLSSAAAIPSGRSGGGNRTKAVEDMSPEEYWRYLDEIERNKG
jgi:hypothetical protein